MNYIILNKKIKELAEQAGYLPDSFGIGHWDMPECKKFAELIIEEACRALDAYDDFLKKHFGVEE